MESNIKQKIQIGLIAIFIFTGMGNSFASVSKEEKALIAEQHNLYNSFTSASLPETLTLTEILKEGSLANPALKDAFYGWKASVHKIKQAKSLDDPQISFKQFIDEVETRVGPQKQMFSVGQKIPFPGKLHTQGESATAIARQKQAHFQKVKLETFYALKDAFFEYWFLYKKILVTEKNMEFLKHFENVAQSKFKSGKAKNQDLLKAQVELGKLENDLLTLNDYRFPLAANLNALMNREIIAEIAWPEEINHEVIPIEEAHVFELFYENNPDLMKADQRIKAATQKLWLARLDYLPDTTVSFDYIRVADGPLNVRDNGQDAMALMFKVNVPLWFGKQKSQVDEAKSIQTSSEAMKNHVEKELEAKLKMIIFRINDAERQIKLYRDALLPKAEQSLNSSETAYSSGEVDFLNLIDSERTLLEFQLGYYKAIRDYEQRLAQLEMMVGTELRGMDYGNEA